MLMSKVEYYPFSVCRLLWRFQDFRLQSVEDFGRNLPPYR